MFKTTGFRVFVLPAFFCFAKALAPLAQNLLSCPLQSCRETFDLAEKANLFWIVASLKNGWDKKGKSTEVQSCKQITSNSYLTRPKCLWFGLWGCPENPWASDPPMTFHLLSLKVPWWRQHTKAISSGGFIAKAHPPIPTRKFPSWPIANKSKDM